MKGSDQRNVMIDLVQLPLPTSIVKVSDPVKDGVEAAFSTPCHVETTRLSIGHRHKAVQDHPKCHESSTHATSSPLEELQRPKGNWADSEHRGSQWG